MTHNEERGHWLKEGLIGLGTGVLYGCTSVAVGHPMDTIKTKMQAQAGYIGGGGMLSSFKSSWVNEGGLRGLYRGALSPLIGSGIYRSTQFAVYEALYTKWDRNRSENGGGSGSGSGAKTEEEKLLRKINHNAIVPFTTGLEYRVVSAAICASTTRAIIECPIEYIKVNGQVGGGWTWKQLYKGFTMQLVRTNGVMVTYFITIDHLRRQHPDIFATKMGQFLASSSAATLGFWIVWPFEVLKNQIQANSTIYHVRGLTPLSPHSGPVSLSHLSVISQPSTMDRLRFLYYVHGFSGFYRGLLPGTLRSIMSNGASMVVFVWAQKKITEWGWR